MRVAPDLRANSFRATRVVALKNDGTRLSASWWMVASMNLGSCAVVISLDGSCLRCVLEEKGAAGAVLWVVVSRCWSALVGASRRFAALLWRVGKCALAVEFHPGEVEGLAGPGGGVLSHGQELA